jgi:hypothetical protein
MKRKVLLGSAHLVENNSPVGFGCSANHTVDQQVQSNYHTKQRTFGGTLGNSVDLGVVVGDMEANGVSQFFHFT